jgi:hypothetical protein
MMNNLAGDSVYQGTDEKTPSLEGSGDIENNEGLENEESMEIVELEYSLSEPTTESTAIVVEVFEDSIDVVHTNVSLGCDMSIYTPEVTIDGKEISVLYMPEDDARECLMDARFSIEIDMEEGTYTLNIMEDTTTFTYEID